MDAAVEKCKRFIESLKNTQQNIYQRIISDLLIIYKYHKLHVFSGPNVDISDCLKAFICCHNNAKELDKVIDEKNTVKFLQLINRVKTSALLHKKKTSWFSSITGFTKNIYEHSFVGFLDRMFSWGGEKIANKAGKYLGKAWGIFLGFMVSYLFGFRVFARNLMLNYSTSLLLLPFTRAKIEDEAATAVTRLSPKYIGATRGIVSALIGASFEKVVGSRGRRTFVFWLLPAMMNSILSFSFSPTTENQARILELSTTAQNFTSNILIFIAFLMLDREKQRQACFQFLEEEAQSFGAKKIVRLYDSFWQEAISLFNTNKLHFFLVKEGAFIGECKLFQEQAYCNCTDVSLGLPDKNSI